MRFFLLVILLNIYSGIKAQSPQVSSSADIFQQIKKLPVFGTVLYIAAHPDDENTRLLSYLANEKLYRTGYLSITRGDGGQNLIGDEQGIDLGLIRTQELLAARRVDGAEQFFTRAYDFGFSKSPEEALRIWEHDKILSDVVWVIRSFRPDVIVARFPATGEGGHGHHTASAILAAEAFDAAADPKIFPEQLKLVSTWKPKRLLWNSFNFAGTNTLREDQLKLDVGGFNPVLGKSYGEIASESRSNHRSQGFGVAAQRGESFEFFATIKGDKPVKDIMDGVDISIDRIRTEDKNRITVLMQDIKNSFSPEQPQLSVLKLTELYSLFENVKDNYWKQQKLKEISRLIETAGGIFMEVTTATPFIAAGDSLKFNISFNNRTGIDIRSASVYISGQDYSITLPEKNVNNLISSSSIIPESSYMATQPYWLQTSIVNGSFNVSDQKLIGLSHNKTEDISFLLDIAGTKIPFIKSFKYKFTDPVKGEIYQPFYILPQRTVHPDPIVFVNVNENTSKQIKVQTRYLSKQKLNCDTCNITYYIPVAKNNGNKMLVQSINDSQTGMSLYSLTEIDYDHIPAIKYLSKAETKVVYADVKTGGKNIGYIPGAGDKVADALTAMGYKVTVLNETDILSGQLSKYDAIVAGIRAYNVHPWLTSAHPQLMKYVENGGVLLSQYNTNSNAGPLKARISPYPFTISRNRITDEKAVVNFLLPEHPLLNYPNKISAQDFDGWVQERSIYHAENTDPAYKKILGMKDPGEKEHDGSLIVAEYGKGRFIYTGLSLFRQLPAGVPGAFRLFANLIAR